MKAKTILAVLLMTGSWVVAQDATPGTAHPDTSTTQTDSTSNPSTQDTQSMPSNATGNTSSTSITGCLSGSPTNGTYSLLDSQTGIAYNLAGNTDSLRSHVGEQVQVTGMASGSSAPSDQTSAGATTAAGTSFQVDTVTKVADHCGVASGPSASTTTDSTSTMAANTSPDMSQSSGQAPQTSAPQTDLPQAVTPDTGTATSPSTTPGTAMTPETTPGAATPESTPGTAATPDTTPGTAVTPETTPSTTTTPEATTPTTTTPNTTTPPQDNPPPQSMSQTSDPAPSSNDQTANTTSGTHVISDTDNQGTLPQTSTILPLLGLLGMGSAGFGFWNLRK